MGCIKINLDGKRLNEVIMIGKILVQAFVPGIIVILAAGAFKVLTFLMEVCGLDYDVDSLTPRTLEGATDISGVTFMGLISVLFLYVFMAITPFRMVKKFIKLLGIESSLLQLILYVLALAVAFFLIKFFSKAPIFIQNLLILLMAASLFTVLTTTFFDFDRQETPFWQYYRCVWYSIWMFIYIKVMQIIDPL